MFFFETRCTLHNAAMVSVAANNTIQLQSLQINHDRCLKHKCLMTAKDITIFFQHRDTYSRILVAALVFTAHLHCSQCRPLY